MFAFLFSLRGLVRGTRISCRYYKSSNSYLVRESSTKRSASTKSRALMYISGFDYRARSLFKTYLLDCIEIPENALIVDCGANVGDFHLALRKCQPQSFRYIGFEPSPHDFVSLAVNVGNEIQTEVFDVALWYEDREVNLYLDVETASSSLIEPRRTTGITSVTSRRLDTFIKAKKIFLLKIEAEGAEPEVLVGAEGILPAVQYIVVDVGPERGKQEESTRDAVVEFLEAHDFSLIQENRGHRKIVLFVNNHFCYSEES